jgi:hypothetical protein
MMKKTTKLVLMGLCTLLLSTSAYAQAPITVDGDMTDWTDEMRLDVAPNTPMVSWHEGVIGETLLRDNSPANPNDLDFMVESNITGLYVTDDDMFLYVRVLLNSRADIRKMIPGTEQYNADMYPSNQHLSLNMSLDPDLFADFADETGMTWGWYYNGIDMLIGLLPDFETYTGESSYEVAIQEHFQDGNGHSFDVYSRRPDLTANVAWNEEFNQVEIAIPKSVLLQPVNIPDFAEANGEFVTFMIAAGAFNTYDDNQWWSQRIANNLDVAGYVYTYGTAWNGQDPYPAPVPLVEIEGAIGIDGDLADWTEDMRLDVEPNNPIVTWHDGIPGVNLLRDNSPANPDNLDYMVDANVAALYVTDDENYLFVRVDMNERADVRRMFPGTEQYDAEMYPANSHLTLNMSLDPDLFSDFADETGMTWGWYYNGIDMIVSLFPNDPEYADSTGFDVPIQEHHQDGNGHSFSVYSRRPELGARLAWNETWNKVEIAIPKAALLQPAHLPDYSEENGEFVTFMIAAGARNSHTDNDWWSQRISNNLDVAGFVYTYGTAWNGEEPFPTSIELVSEIANSFKLEQNYPNPFNPTTNIRFSLPESQLVTVKVYDILGREIATLANGFMSAGSYNVPFNATNLSSGVYLYTVQAGTRIMTGKMMLAK